jgi:hypothetical protein
MVGVLEQWTGKALADESSIIVQNGAKTVQNEALAGAELQCEIRH